MPTPTRWWLIASFLAGFAFAMWAEELIVHWKENSLHLSAPKLHFLEGKPLDRLKNGDSVPYDFQLTLWVGSRDTVFERYADRFVFSYDLWEEKFSVTKARAPRRSISHLTADAAESWCLGNLQISTAGIGGEKPLWMRLEIRSEEPKEQPPILGDPGVSLTSLIEIFSRPARGAQPHWTLDAGPLRLDDIK
ncbi:MAG: hypothetical protein ACRD9L_06435, partial [Bryobacteraceae bacterium]